MRVLIIEEQDVIIKGITTLLKQELENVDIQGVHYLKDARNILLTYNIDTVIMDVNVNKENGLNLIDEVQQKGIKPKFIIFTNSLRKGDFLRAKKLDVMGYILKSATLEDIGYAIGCIKKNKKYYDSQIEQDKDNNKRRQILAILTQREQEVFFELGRGLTNTQIAEALFISESTVKKHISSLLAKLGLTHRTEAALYATKLWRRKDDGIK